MPKRAPFTVLGVVVFWIPPPPRIPIFWHPPFPKVSCKDVYSERIQRAGSSVQVDLEVNEGEGGPFLRKGGSPPPASVGLSAQHRGVVLPAEADRAATSGTLAVTCHVGRSRYRYASREVLQGPVDEGQDRSLECFDILTLLVLQEPHANERVDFRYV